MRRFHVPDLRDGVARIQFTAAQSKHIVRVLRLSPGDVVEVFNGAGVSGTATIEAASAGGAQAAVRELSQVPWPLPWSPILYLAMIRPQRFEWAIEKAAELGAFSIVPVVTERTAHADGTVSEARQRRWQQIAIEAAEQCGSAFVASIGAPVSLGESLQAAADLRLLASEPQAARQARDTPAHALRTRLLARPHELPRIALYVGPEGGFSDSEVRAAEEAGCHLVTLGPNVLRADTAAVTLLAMLVGTIEADDRSSS